MYQINDSCEQVTGKKYLETLMRTERGWLTCVLGIDFVIGGILFQHIAIHNKIWLLPDNITENQGNHVRISRKFKGSLKDVRVMRGADAYTDHHFAGIKKMLKKIGLDGSLQDAESRFETELLKDQVKKEEFQIALKTFFRYSRGPKKRMKVQIQNGKMRKEHMRQHNIKLCLGRRITSTRNG